MKYLKISNKKSNIEVSKLVLGSDYMPTNPELPEMYKILELFLNKGGNCIDTARIYNNGTSEQAIGDWIKTKNNRDKVIISSKGAHPNKESMDISRLDKDSICDDLENSLKALKTDYIDIYWLHRDDETLPVEPIIDTLNGFINAGKIRVIGASNWSTKRISLANAYAKSSGQIGFSCSQIQWSLAHTEEQFYLDHSIVNMSNEEYNWYRENKFPVFAFAAQAGGFFHKLNSGSELSTKISTRYSRPDNIKRYEKLRALAKEKNTAITAPLLNYIMCNALPAVAIVGCKSTAQLSDSLIAINHELTNQECDILYKI